MTFLQTFSTQSAVNPYFCFWGWWQDMKWKLSAVELLIVLSWWNQVPVIFTAYNTSFPGDYLERNDVHWKDVSGKGYLINVVAVTKTHNASLLLFWIAQNVIGRPHRSRWVGVVGFFLCCFFVLFFYSESNGKWERKVPWRSNILVISEGYSQWQCVEIHIWESEVRREPKGDKKGSENRKTLDQI